MAAGGTAPMRRSRVMPPALPAANANTITPKISRRCRVAATAPLMANTKVPPRSSTISRTWIMCSPVPARPYRPVWIIEARCASSGEPRLRRDDQRLNSCFECRMDDRQKARIVIRRNLVEPACSFGLRVRLGIGPADEPEHRGHAPFGAERSEILARRCRPGLADPVSRKVLPKRIHDAPGRLRIIHHQGIAVQRSDLRRSGSARSRCLGIDDALDRCQHTLADILIEGAHI